MAVDLYYNMTVFKVIFKLYRDSKVRIHATKLLNLLALSIALISCNSGSSSTTTNTDQWMPLSVAYEILNTGNVMSNPESAIPTYKNGGSNSITGDEWES